MTHVITATKTSLCTTCGEQVIPGDRILLHGTGPGRFLYKGNQVFLGGRSSHEDCAPEIAHQAPHLLWAHITNLLAVVQGMKLSTDDVNLRRFVAACKQAKRNRHQMPEREDKHPALALSPALLDAYRKILKQAGKFKNGGGQYWTPWDVAKNEPWQAPVKTEAEAQPEPERLAYDPTTDQERRDRMADLRHKLLRTRKAL